MAKQFNKTITTVEQKALYAECERIKKERNEIELKLKENWKVYWQMEGKYAVGTMSDPYVGQGMRGYVYQYPNEEVKNREKAEREAYCEEYICPLKDKSTELYERLGATLEALCVALWGYGREIYGYKQNLKNAEKELAEQMAYVEELKNKIAELEKINKNFSQTS